MPAPAPTPRPRPALPLFLLAAVGGVLAVRVTLDGPLADTLMKLAVAAVALGCLLWEGRRADVGRSIDTSAIRTAATTLVVLAVITQASVFSRTPQLFHAWDQYHHYLGAKYHEELGYDRLYACTIVAESELDDAAPAVLGDRLVRTLGSDNQLVLVGSTGLLEHPERCTAHFSGPRWSAFKADVRFFRGRIGADWPFIATDHGFNAPPTWTLVAGPLVRALPASDTSMWIFAAIDGLLVVATFLALAWAFGTRTGVLACVFWACFEPASIIWTGGSLLRFDWLLLAVLAVVGAKRGRMGLAGACMAAAAVLRIFPALLLLGWLIALVVRSHRRRRVDPRLPRFVAGVALAGGISMGLSVASHGMRPWVDFYDHTIVRHRQIPMLNNMGLPVLFTHAPGADPAPSAPLPGVAGEMERTAELDASFVARRVDRFNRLHAPFLAVAAVLGLFVALAIARTRALWTAPCLATAFTVLFTSLTCYYHAILILLVPLARRRPDLEIALVGAAGFSQVLVLAIPGDDTRYFAFSIISVGLVLYFAHAGVQRGAHRREPPTHRARAQVGGDE